MSAGRALMSVLGVGAWAGFITGGLLGVLVDVVSASGDGLLRVGHRA